MEIKGMILKGGRVSINCCEGIIDIDIDGTSLYTELDRLFSPDAEEHWNGQGEDKQKELRYIILDEYPQHNMSFNQAFTEHTMNLLYAEHHSGCYSEWTCGYGGFDYVLNAGKSIFDELASFEGKYIHLSIE